MNALSKKTLLQCFLLVVVTLLFAAGCAKKPVATSAGTDTTQSQEMMSQDMDPNMTYSDGLDEMAVGEEGAADYGVTTETVDSLQRIHFNFDMYTLSAEAQAVLVSNAAYMQANPDQTFRIEGYCDERGSDEYNLALGQRRALAAKNYLVTLGIDPERLSVISYGEELPLDPASTEEAYALNRRAEFKAVR